MKINLPAGSKHKGQNGKILIVGGSNLFHSASLWSAKTAAHIVDMVFYASVKQNNEIVKKNKELFSDGIVIDREQIFAYAAEADVILLGPGLERGETNLSRLENLIKNHKSLTASEWENDTYLITNFILASFPEKKFVLDAGALQMLELKFLPPQSLLTPHQLEWEGLQKKASTKELEAKLQAATILRKNIIDEVWQDNQLLATIKGGNAGLTKGGSGDVLAGLAAGLYVLNEAPVAAILASQAVKKTAEELFSQVGPFFTTTQLLMSLPAVLWALAQKS